MKTLILLSLVAIFCSCSTTSNIATLATPANVQSSLTLLGAAVSSKLSSSDKSLLHTFATDVLALSSAQVDSETISSLGSSIASAASGQYVKPLVDTAIIELNLALAKFGSHNAQSVAYAKAVGNGLLGAGF